MRFVLTLPTVSIIKLLSLAFVCALFLMMPYMAHGQLSIGPEPLVLETNPSYPEPNNLITVLLKSYATDLSRATITWYVNGSLSEGAQNKTELQMTAGELGSATSVSANVRTDTGELVSKSITIRPSSMSILWQADTYVPPFYKGKALASAGGTVTLVASPEFYTTSGRKLSDNEIVFTWEQNGRVIPNSSGKGKSTVTISGPEVYKNLIVTLRAASIDGTLTQTESVRLGATEPEIILYENHPTLGIVFDRSFGEQSSLTTDEITLSAQPFYFTAASADSREISYEWRVNGQVAENPSPDQSLITLRPTGASGRAIVEVKARHGAYIFQQAQSKLDVSFEGSNESFGF